MDFGIRVIQGQEYISVSERLFEKPIITIGRNQDNDFILPDDDKVIGRQHAQIAFAGEGYQLFDLQSKNYTFLNDKRVMPGRGYSLKNKDCIRIGKYILEFFIPHAEDELIHENRDVLFNDHPVQEPIETPVEDVFTDKGHSGDFLKAQPFLFHTLIGLIRGLRHFRREFIGMTDVQSEDSYLLHSSSEEELYDHFFSNTMSREETSKRLNLLKRASDEVLLHQVALLEGYRSSIHKGCFLLLDRLDYKKIKEEVASESLRIGSIKISYRYLPVFRGIRQIRILMSRYKELIREDKNILEKRLFRPALINAYLKTMSGRD